MIIAPRRELITQVSEMGNSVYDRFKSESILAYPPWQPSTSILSNYILSTPNQIFKYMKSPYFKSIDTIILDEVDFLLDSSSVHFVWPILRYLKNHLTLPLQFIFSGATISFEGKKSPGVLLKKFLPDLQIIESNFNHRINPSIKIQKIELENEEEKLQKLQTIISSTEYKSILIFVNTVKSMEIIDEYLKINKFIIPYEMFNKYDLPYVKEKKLKAFLNNEVKILVTTDIISRGINTTNVDCVIQYDFPKDVISYIHRCGRTGRCNTSGTVINFVNKGENNLLAKEIEKIDLSSSKLDNLFSRKRRLNKKIKKEIKLKDEERKKNGELESLKAGNIMNN